MSAPPGLPPLYQTLAPAPEADPAEAPHRFAPDPALGTPRRLLRPPVRPVAPWPSRG